jgi:hypothetical protein
MVHPEAWINHDKGQVRDIKPDRTESADDDVERDVEHRKPSSMRHTNGRDDRPDGRESMEGRETSDDLDDRDLELEIGKEVLKLIRRYAAENKAPRMRSSARSEKGED